MNKQAMNKMIERKNVPIKDLHLWANSPRLIFLARGVKPTEEEIIKYFCSDPQIAIRRLAKAMAQTINRVLPREPLVGYGKEGNYTIIEGNRRLIVYKLIANPDLAPNEELKKMFLNFRNNEAKIDENFSVECLVALDQTSVSPYLEITHMRNHLIRKQSK